MAIRTNSKSGWAGVSWNEHNQRWSATLRVNGQLLYLGQFKDKDAAVAARTAAEREHLNWAQA